MSANTLSGAVERIDQAQADALAARRDDPKSYYSWGDLGGASKPGKEGRFVKSTSIDDKTKSQVDTSINEIQKVYDVQMALFKGLQEPLDWSEVVPEAVAAFKDSLIAIDKAIIAHNEKRNGISGIDKQLSHIVDKDKNAIPDTTRKYQVLEMRLLQFQKATKRLRSLCTNDAFRAAYKSFKDTLQSLKLHVNSRAFLDHRITSVKAVLAKLTTEMQAQPEQAGTKRWETRAMKKYHLDALLLVVQAANNLKSQVLGIDQSPCVPLDEAIREAKALAEPLKERLESGNLVREPLQECPNLTITDEILATFHVSKLDWTEGRFRFANNMSYKDWSWYKVGVYKQSGALGDEMQELVGYKLVGLLRKLDERLTTLSVGKLQPLEQGKATVKDDLDYYQNVMQSLAAKLKVLKAQTATVPLDAIGADVIRYAQGLEEALVTVRRKIKLCYQLSTKDEAKKIDNLSIFEAEEWLFSHFDEAKLSPIAELKSLQKAEKLYQASKLIMYTKNQWNLKSEKLADKYMVMTAKILCEIHAQKDEGALTLSGWEEVVFDALHRGDELSTLRYTNEPTGELPVSIRAYLFKRITNALFNPNVDYDIEVELVIYLLKSRYPTLLQESQKNPLFKDLLEAYDREYDKRRLGENQLKEATELFGLILEAYREERNPLAYALAWQRFFEFNRNNNGDFERASPLERLFLQAKARLSPAVYNYVPIRSNDIITSDLDPQREPGVLIEFLLSNAREIQKNSLNGELAELQKEVFCSYLFKALCFCLFGRDTAQKRAAHRVINQLFTREEYGQLREKLPQDLLSMLHENTMNKIIDGSPAFSQIEFTLFREGPLASFFEDPYTEVANTKVQHALFVLISQEAQAAQKPITQAFIESVGEVAFKKWYGDYQHLLQDQDIAQRLANLVLTESRDGRPEQGKTQLVTVMRQALGDVRYEQWFGQHRDRAIE